VLLQVIFTTAGRFSSVIFLSVFDSLSFYPERSAYSTSTCLPGQKQLTNKETIKNIITIFQDRSAIKIIQKFILSAVQKNAVNKKAVPVKTGRLFYFCVNF